MAKAVDNDGLRFGDIYGGQTLHLLDGVYPYRRILLAHHARWAIRESTLGSKEKAELEAGFCASEWCFEGTPPHKD